MPNADLVEHVISVVLRGIVQLNRVRRTHALQALYVLLLRIKVHTAWRFVRRVKTVEMDINVTWALLRPLFAGKNHSSRSNISTPRLLSSSIQLITRASNSMSLCLSALMEHSWDYLTLHDILGGRSPYLFGVACCALFASSIYSRLSSHLPVAYP